MNIFYAPPGRIEQNRITLAGREANHAVKALRYQRGDQITVVDGEGGWYEGVITNVYDEKIEIRSEHSVVRERPKPGLALGIGIIKKKDRLEMAVEKAVELGAQQVKLFRSEHTVKENIRKERLESIALSAMKQSLRAYLPEIQFYSSLADLLGEWDDGPVLVAHQSGKEEIPVQFRDAGKVLLLVGPEGGFSEKEIEQVRDGGGAVISLGEYRFRTETAAIVFLARFLNEDPSFRSGQRI